MSGNRSSISIQPGSSSSKSPFGPSSSASASSSRRPTQGEQWYASTSLARPGPSSSSIRGRSSVSPRMDLEDSDDGLSIPSSFTRSAAPISLLHDGETESEDGELGSGSEGRRSYRSSLEWRRAPNRNLTLGESAEREVVSDERDRIPEHSASASAALYGLGAKFVSPGDSPRSARFSNDSPVRFGKSVVRGGEIRPTEVDWDAEEDDLDADDYSASGPALAGPAGSSSSVNLALLERESSQSPGTSGISKHASMVSESWDEDFLFQNDDEDPDGDEGEGDGDDADADGEADTSPSRRRTRTRTLGAQDQDDDGMEDWGPHGLSTSSSSQTIMASSYTPSPDGRQQASAQAPGFAHLRLEMPRPSSNPGLPAAQKSSPPPPPPPPQQGPTHGRSVSRQSNSSAFTDLSLALARASPISSWDSSRPTSLVGSARDARSRTPSLTGPGQRRAGSGGTEEDAELRTSDAESGTEGETETEEETDESGLEMESGEDTETERAETGLSDPASTPRRSKITARARGERRNGAGWPNAATVAADKDRQNGLDVVLAAMRMQGWSSTPHLPDEQAGQEPHAPSSLPSHSLPTTVGWSRPQNSLGASMGILTASSASGAAGTHAGDSHQAPRKKGRKSKKRSQAASMDGTIAPSSSIPGSPERVTALSPRRWRRSQPLASASAMSFPESAHSNEQEDRMPPPTQPARPTSPLERGWNAFRSSTLMGGPGSPGRKARSRSRSRPRTADEELEAEAEAEANGRPPSASAASSDIGHSERHSAAETPAAEHANTRGKGHRTTPSLSLSFGLGLAGLGLSTKSSAKRLSLIGRSSSGAKTPETPSSPRGKTVPLQGESAVSSDMPLQGMTPRPSTPSKSISAGRRAESSRPESPSSPRSGAHELLARTPPHQQPASPPRRRSMMHPHKSNESFARSPMKRRGSEALESEGEGSSSISQTQDWTPSRPSFPAFLGRGSSPNARAAAGLTTGSSSRSVSNATTTTESSSTSGTGTQFGGSRWGRVRTNGRGGEDGHGAESSWGGSNADSETTATSWSPGTSYEGTPTEPNFPSSIDVQAGTLRGKASSAAAAAAAAAAGDASAKGQASSTATVTARRTSRRPAQLAIPTFGTDSSADSASKLGGSGTRKRRPSTSPTPSPTSLTMEVPAAGEVARSTQDGQSITPIRPGEGSAVALSHPPELASMPEGSYPSTAGETPNIAGAGPVTAANTGTGGRSKGKAAIKRRNSLSDLRIPSRISRAQDGIRADIGYVRDFAKGIDGECPILT